MSQPRILTISHGHPDLNPGGGEIAAYNLHNRLNAGGEFRSVFLARHNDKRLKHGGTPFAGTGRPGEVLFHSNMPERFLLSQADKSRVWRDFPDLLERVQPDIVHFHHYVHLGLELISEVQRFNPSIRIVLTLHEYMAVCHNRGLMVKSGGTEPCYRSTPADCARCFPAYSPADFMLRKRFIESHFDAVDTFIAPSRFLASRYVAWGLSPARVTVIENVLPTESVNTVRTTPPADSPLQLAYFGQISELKGVDLLLEAVALLPEEVARNVTVAVHGNALEKQPRAFRRKFHRLLANAPACVSWRGAYRQDQLPGLLQATDWIVVPSRWWENSPMVILEARQQGVPAICSDLGALSEKVEPDITGLHFAAGSAPALSKQIERAVDERTELARWRTNLHAHAAKVNAFDNHVKRYRQLLDSSPSLASVRRAS